MDHKEATWQTHLGNEVSVRGCSDEHLANTIDWLKHYRPANGKMLALLKKEAKKRGLAEEFLAKAQYPYKDGKGNYLVWCFENNEPKVVGSYVRG